MANVQQRAHAALSALLPPLTRWTSEVLFAPYRAPAELPLLESEDLDELLGRRMGPLLLELLRSRHAAGLATEVAGGLDHVLDLLDTFTGLGRLRTGALLAEARHACDLLDENSIPFAVSKGPGIARYYREPQLRPYNDIDVLVRAPDFAAARSLFASAGWNDAPGRREQRRYFERLCREAVNLERGELGRLDLHHHVPPWLWAAQLQTGALIGRSQQVRFGAHEFPVLDAVDNFIISCLHIVSDRSEPGHSLVVWRDILELGRVVAAGTPGPDAVAARAAGPGLLGWIGAVVNSLPADVRPFRVPAAWLEAPIEHPRRLGVMLNHGQPGRPVRRHLARLPAVPNGVLYAGGVTFPSQEFLESHVQGSLKLLRWLSLRRA